MLLARLKMPKSDMVSSMTVRLAGRMSNGRRLSRAPTGAMTLSMKMATWDRMGVATTSSRSKMRMSALKMPMRCA